jgi:hypothetical protein
MNRLGALARSPLGRIVAAAAGLGCVYYLIRRSGPADVWAALTRAPGLFPVVVLCEAGIATCEIYALYLLYGPSRSKVPPLELVRTGLICYAVMALVPFGRAVSEATRAALLAKYVGGPKAAAEATRMQGVTLIGNAVISVPIALGALAVLGPSWLPALVTANLVLMVVLGAGLLFAGRHLRVGQWLGARVRGGQAWGPAFDAQLREEEAVPVGAIVSVSLARCIQTFQRTILVAAVGGGFSLLRGLVAQGIQLVSGAVGDIVPGQVGLSEAAYTLSAKVLSLSESSAVSIALLTHLAVLFWVCVGSLVPLFWPAPRGPLAG